MYCPLALQGFFFDSSIHCLQPRVCTIYSTAMTSLTRLAATISEASALLSAYIVKNNLPNPSFEVGAPPELPIPVEDHELQASRLRLLQAAQDLASLALGPVEDLRWKAWNVSCLSGHWPWRRRAR